MSFYLFIRKAYRFIRYSSKRKIFLSDLAIKRKQNQLIKQSYPQTTEKLIVFIVPGRDWSTGNEKITGGAISIVSICEETKDLQNIHHSQTILCTMTDSHLLLRHELFENSSTVYRFDQISHYFRSLQEIIIHIPEFMVKHFYEEKQSHWIRKIPKVQINILNQNISLMPTVEDVTKLRGISDLITMTTAHQKYCNSYYRSLYNIPIHKFSTLVSPEKYHFKSWSEKENLIVVSPDEQPLKQEILNRLSEVPGLKIQIIQNLTYEQFKVAISKAKWGLTFGEGLDGYIIEPIFSGAIGFAVYNEEFFTPDYKDFETIYSSYDEMLAKMNNDIENLDNENLFIEYQQKQFELCAKHYSYMQYQQNIKEFYKGNYTFN